jgi:hypothetical protein
MREVELPDIAIGSPAEIASASARKHANLMRRIRAVFPSGQGSHHQRSVEAPGRGPSATESIAAALAGGMIAGSNSSVTPDQAYEIYKRMYDEVSIQRGE